MANRRSFKPLTGLVAHRQRVKPILEHTSNHAMLHASVAGGRGAAYQSGCRPHPLQAPPSHSSLVQRQCQAVPFSHQPCSTASHSCIYSRQARQHAVVRAQDAASSEPQPSMDRRKLMSAGVLAATAAATCGATPAKALRIQAPPGFRALVDKLDGYSLIYPERWLSVTITGNDCFLRNPTNINENLFVGITSPSSSQFRTVLDLGSPEQTAQQILQKYLNQEFMSTRLGIKREGQILSASGREGSGGRPYYDVAIRMTSYASRSPYLSTREEVLKDYGIEWDRVLLTTLGVANKRLYELRLQTATDTYPTSSPMLSDIAHSFTLNEVDLA